MTGIPFTVDDPDEYGGYAPGNIYFSGLTGNWADGMPSGIVIENTTNFMIREWDHQNVNSSGAEHIAAGTTIGLAFNFHTAT